MSSAPTPAHPAPHDGNGHFHIPKWLVPILLTYVVTQGGASIFGTIKQSNAADTAATTAKAATEIAAEQKKHNEAVDAQMKWMHQQLMALHGRVGALEAKGKP